jgi:ATP-dependent DNA ligase
MAEEKTIPSGIYDAVVAAKHGHMQKLQALRDACEDDYELEVLARQVEACIRMYDILACRP